VIFGNHILFFCASNMPPNPSQARGRHWCFTIQNWTEVDVERLTALVPTEASYVIFGREIAPLTGTPHLQGFIAFTGALRFNRAKEVIGHDAHIELARNSSQSIMYCKKENNYTEHGAFSMAQGKRSDLDDFKDDVKAGVLNMKELREKHSEVVAKYTGFCHQYVVDNTPLQQPELFPLHMWQQDLYQLLQRAADPRKIIFVVDCVGNKGKSWFAKYYLWLHPKDTQIIQPGKRNDMAYVIDVSTRVLFMDAPRSKQGDYIQYDFLEQIKDGMVTSYKYTCINKVFPLKVHVVVNMNQEPDMTKLSMDRYMVVNLS